MIGNKNLCGNKHCFKISPKSSFSHHEKLLFASQKLTFWKVKSYLLELAKMANGDYSFSFSDERNEDPFANKIIYEVYGCLPLGPVGNLRRNNK
jgi:hypothetical protein